MFTLAISKKLNQEIHLTKASAGEPSSLLKCLDNLQDGFKKNKKIASLWKDWPKIAGKELAPHCTPLSFYKGVLIVGANHPQWIQALIFNKPQLVAALKAEGHDIKELKIKNYYKKSNPKQQAELSTWEKHPSRIDIHGISKCKVCNLPAPSGEVTLWGKCGLCRRKDLSKKNF